MAAVTPAAPAAALPAAIPPMPRASNSKLDGFNEVDTQPLFYRIKQAAGAQFGALSKLDFFVTRKNAAPHITNCEEAGSMPNTSGFKIAAIEIVPNGACTPGAFRAMVNSARLIIEVGTKGIEKINQPAVFFGSTQHGSAVDNTCTLKAGIYQLNKGEEINLEPDQPFRVYLQFDDTGYTVPANEVLDFYLKFHGQKRGRVSLG